MATPKFVSRGTLATSETTLATVPAGKQWLVKEIILTNITASAATATVRVVTSGSAAGNSFSIVHAKSVPANDVLVFALNTVMNAGDFLSGLAGTASAINLNASVVELP